MTNYYATRKQALQAAKGWRKSGYNAKVMAKGSGLKPYGVLVRARKPKNPMGV